jgi:hypothetical protein
MEIHHQSWVAHVAPFYGKKTIRIVFHRLDGFKINTKHHQTTMLDYKILKLMFAQWHFQHQNDCNCVRCMEPYYS